MDIVIHGDATMAAAALASGDGGRDAWWQGHVDGTAEAAALIDTAGHILWTTAAFDRIMQEEDGVRIAGAIPRARLLAMTAGEQVRLDAALARATTRTAPQVAAARCTRPSGRSRLIAVARPIPWATRLLRHDDGAAVLTLVDPVHRPAPAPTLWREAFDLTPCEAALAALLMEGHSLESAAAARDCRPTTLRVHLRRIFAKTDVSRQSDLVSLLARVGR